MLHAINDDRRWLLLALWEDVHHLGRWCFGANPERRAPPNRDAALVLAGVCVVSLMLIVRRVRAVEVVG